MSIVSRTAVAVVVCISLALACSSTGRRRVDSTTSDIARFQNEIVSAQKQIEILDSIMASISESSGPQLVDAFDAYRRETRLLGSQANTVRRRADSMNASGQKFFTAWEEEAQQMGNASIQQAAAERRAGLLATYQSLSAAMEATGAAYRPYESSLADILSFLDNDLTPGGVTAISGEITEARQQGRDVHARIKQVLGRSAAVRQALSPQG